jgi:hypothetical protein
MIQMMEIGASVFVDTVMSYSELADHLPQILSSQPPLIRRNSKRTRTDPVNQRMESQLAIVQELMESQRHVEEINAANESLQIVLATQSGTIKRLLQLSLASASLLSSVDSTASQTEISSLQILSHLQYSTAMTTESDEEEADSIKIVTGKFLNELLALVVQGITKESGGVELISLIQLEFLLNELLKEAENKELIPKTNPNASWKKNVAKHQPIYDQILKKAREGPGEENDDDDDTELG